MTSFKTQFILSREYLGECFDQTLPHGKNAKPNFLLPAFMLFAGVTLLLFTEQPKVAGGMLIALALLEIIHYRFQKSWWLTRQMLAKSANSQVTLSINSKGVQTQNPFTKTDLIWPDIKDLIETDLGIILVTNSGDQHYLSKSILSIDIIKEINASIKR